MGTWAAGYLDAVEGVRSNGRNGWRGCCGRSVASLGESTVRPQQRNRPQTAQSKLYFSTYMLCSRAHHGGPPLATTRTRWATT